MTFFKRVIRINILAFSVLFTAAMGGTVFKYTPISVDEVMVMVPYASITTYTPPANSLAHTTITTTEGKKIRVDRIPDGLVFEGHENQIVLLEVYGYTCPHCIASIPGYNRLQAKYPDDVFVITVENYGLSDIGLKQYVIDHSMHYSTVSKEKDGDIINYISILTGWSPGIGVPWLMVFDRDGKIEGTPMLGDIQENTVDTMIQGLL